MSSWGAGGLLAGAAPGAAAAARRGEQTAGHRGRAGQRRASTTLAPLLGHQWATVLPRLSGPNTLGLV